MRLPPQGAVGAGRRKAVAAGGARPTSWHGFTLVEAAFAVAITGVLLTSAVGTFATIAHGRQIQAERRLAYPLAQQLMAEILSAAFVDPGTNPTFGPEPGETRATYDDVDDYTGLTESPPATRAGVAMAGYAGWSRAVAVAYVDPSTLAVSTTATTLKRITVTVTSPAGKVYALVGLRSSLGAYERPPAAQSTFVTGVSINAQPEPPRPRGPGRTR
jgi:MSHA pilin protein MshD